MLTEYRFADGAGSFAEQLARIANGGAVRGQFVGNADRVSLCEQCAQFADNGAVSRTTGAVRGQFAGNADRVSLCKQRAQVADRLNRPRYLQVILSVAKYLFS